MAPRKKKSTKARKTTKKVERYPMRVIGNSLLRLMKWFVVSLVRKMRKNPLVSVGFCLFLGFFSFFVYHTSVNQNIISRSFFFHNNSNMSKAPASELTIEHLLQNNANPSISRDANHIRGEQTHSPPPLVRPTPMLDNQIQTSSIGHAPFLNIIPQVKPKPIPTSMPTNILSKEKAQIMRVQAALRSFGNNGLIINGVADNKTKAAILAFQKMFALKETGIIDRELLSKMREVGLIENDSHGLY